MADEVVKPKEIMDKDKLIDILTEELPLLRAKIGFT